MTKHKTHEFVKDDAARGGHQVRAKWLPTNRRNMVRSGPGKTQLAVNVKPSVHIAPPLTVSTLSMTNASPFVNLHTHRGQCQSDTAWGGYSRSSQGIE